MNTRRRYVVLAIVVVLAATRPAGAVEVADIFGPEMVIQRDTPVPIWGTAPPAEKVTVRFGAQRKTVTADKFGRWTTTLDPMPASAEPRSLVVQGDGDPISIDNVRVGEVWLVLTHQIGKQFSCEGPVPDDLARIRVFGGDRRNLAGPTPRQAVGNNRPWGPGDRASEFDLLTIPLANRLIEALDTPVGIVRVAVGELDATIPVDGFTAVPALADIAREVETWYPTTPRGRQAFRQWYAEMQAWRTSLSRKIADNRPVEPKQPPLVPGPVLGDPTQPTVVFNRQIHPLVPFAFRGVLHVHDDDMQRNPPSTKDSLYGEKMRALIAGLRIVFGRADLAFAFTQRSQPSIHHAHTVGGKDNRGAVAGFDFDAWHGHRDRQRRAATASDVGMVVTLDVENYPGKVGERFARWALADVYDRGGASSGPIYRDHRIEGDRIVVRFDHVDGGLMTAGYPVIGRPLVKQDASPRFFAVAGEDRIFHRAEARIEGDTVVVRSDLVPRPVAVRYACHFDPRGMNLYNGAGLPASPFATDDWPFDGLAETIERFSDMSPWQLVAQFGYPTMPHSHTAAKALASRGEAVALPIVNRLLVDKNPDRRCGGLRTLGYLHAMDIVAGGSRYYGQEPQEVTPPIAKAIARIAHAAADPDPHVRRLAAEALALIGAENEATFTIIKKLALDDDALVRTAALRVCKYRFKTHAHNTAVAYAVLREKPLGDRMSAALAGTLLNHYRIKGSIDILAAARYFQKVGPGQGGDVISDLGDMLRRIQLPDGDRKALGHPEVMRSLLHLYSLGYRKYFLYGIWHWVDMQNHAPAVEVEIRRLQREIERLRREKPDGWEDLSGRYAAAIEGLRAEIDRALSKGR